MIDTQKIIDSLYEELKRASEKEQNAELLFVPERPGTVENFIKAQGYTNGILEAISIVKSIKED